MSKKPKTTLTAYGTIPSRSQNEIDASHASMRDKRVPFCEIFITFLLIGATSFGGGVVAYLRNALVLQKNWMDEEQFFSSLEIELTLNFYIKE